MFTAWCKFTLSESINLSNREEVIDNGPDLGPVDRI